MTSNKVRTSIVLMGITLFLKTRGQLISETHPLLSMKLYEFILTRISISVYLNLTKFPLHFIRKRNNQNQYNKENNIALIIFVIGVGG